MKVDRSKAVTQVLDGHAYFFCSEHCRHAFQADPATNRRSGGQPIVAEQHGGNCAHAGIDA